MATRRCAELRIMILSSFSAAENVSFLASFTLEKYQETVGLITATVMIIQPVLLIAVIGSTMQAKMVAVISSSASTEAILET